MMKTTRLIHALWVAALAIGFAGCASDNEPTSAAGKDADSPKELTFTAGTPDDGSTQTRVAYEDAGLTLTWQADDKLLMAGFDGGGSYKGQKDYTYKGTAGATSGDFKGDAVADATTYTAYYPSTVQLDAAGANPTLSMDGQKQSADGNTDHLKDYMLLQAINVTPDVPFSLTMKSSIMKFDLKNIPTEVGNLRSLIWAVSSDNGNKYLVLNFPEGVVTFGSSKNTLTAYLGFMPQEMSMGSNGKFTVTLMGDKTYRRQIDVSSGMTYKEGKRYTATINDGWKLMDHMTFTTRVTTVGQEYTPFASTTIGAPADMVIDWGQNEKPLFISSGATVFSHEYQYTGDYTITIYSAQTDVTQRQIPILAFSGTGLLSVATPLLKMGTTDLKRLFVDCALLAELPQGLFDNHPNVWSFQYTFKGCKALTSLPDGLFDKNTKATNFNSCFRACEGLRSLPNGLFANNKAATDFRNCFSGCRTLKLNKLIFGSTEAGEEDTERFKDVTEAMDFGDCFYNVGADLNSDAGEAPTLWLYKTGGKTWTTTNCFTGATKLSNYGNIPTAWGGEN